MNLSIDLTPAEANRAVYEYLVRRGYPDRMEVQSVVRSNDSAFERYGICAHLLMKTCSECDDRTVLQGFGDRVVDCKCAAPERAGGE